MKKGRSKKPRISKARNDIEKIRHSLSHLLAAAVLQIYPNAKLGIGPTIENGFYYDFDFGKNKIDESVLPKLEKIMKDLIGRNLKFKRANVSYAQAKKIFKNQPYKLELIEEFKNKRSPSLFIRRLMVKKKFSLISARVRISTQLRLLIRKLLRLKSWQVLIGRAMKKMQCLPVFTDWPFILKMNLIIIYV